MSNDNKEWYLNGKKYDKSGFKGIALPRPAQLELTMSDIESRLGQKVKIRK